MKMLQTLKDVTVHGTTQLQRCLGLLDVICDKRRYVFCFFPSSRKEMNDIVQLSYQIL